MKKENVNKTEIRDTVVDFIIGVLENLEPLIHFEELYKDEELFYAANETKRYSKRLINYLKRIREEEYKREV